MKGDRVYLIHILECIEWIESYTTNGYAAFRCLTSPMNWCPSSTRSSHVCAIFPRRKPRPARRPIAGRQKKSWTTWSILLPTIIAELTQLHHPHTLDYLIRDYVGHLQDHLKQIFALVEA